jgi:hypothetical protein
MSVDISPANGVQAAKPKLRVGNAINSTENAKATISTTTANAIGEFQYAPLSTPYRVLQQYHSKPTKIRVACVGAGAGGLCLSYKIVSFDPEDQTEDWLTILGTYARAR